MADRLQNIHAQLNPLFTEAPIQAYRRLSTVNKKELRTAILGINEHWIQKAYDFILKNPNVFRHPHLQQMTREEERQIATKMFLCYAATPLGTYQEYLTNPNSFSSMSYAFFTYYPALSAKMGVHFYLYNKTISNLGTERHQHFVERASEFKDIGCFSLTQVLHGSNVKGLLTTAHYDHKQKEFVINSPSRDAMKFWIGGAASTANMTVVWAQLYVDGTCHGVHAFIVPIRRKDNHEILPGITIGDCGPKIGLHGTDNGFLLFENVRIPRENLLCRLSGVDENGKFYSTIPSPEKRFGIQLGALSGGRVLFSFAAPGLALMALTIAIRYTLSRRQFSAPKSQQQILLFDYPLTKYRLIPLLAQTLVYHMGGQELVWTWDANMKNLLDPKNKVIQELHAVSSALKAKSSWFTSQVINECRQMLGGHGYSAFSRLGAMFNDNDVTQTYEGDNNVLLQQTAKYILQAARKLAKGKENLSKTLVFLIQPPEPKTIDEKNVGCLANLELIFQKRTADKMVETVEELMNKKAEGGADFDIWNKTQVFFAHPLAHHYGDLYYIQASRRIMETVKETRTRQVIGDMVRLWACNTLVNAGYGSEEERKILKGRVLILCEELSKEAVGILDAISPPAGIIGSPFADENGDGMKKYYNMLYSAKNAFKKPSWYQDVTNRNLA